MLGEQVDSGWALPCMPAGGGKERGMLFLPQVGDTVWIEFAAGDVSRPIWVGTFWGAPDSTGGADDLGTETGPRRRPGDGKDATPTLGVLKTKSGHELTFDDDGEVVLLANGNGKSSIRFEQDGGVVITAETIKLGASARGEGRARRHVHAALQPAHPPDRRRAVRARPRSRWLASHLSAKVTTE